MALSVVIIEDDQSIRQYVKSLLLENNFSVRAASDGLSGLKLIEKVQPDLVILDLVLPDITGESVCATIRKDLPDTSIIILTAKDSVTKVVEGLNLGADDYITKPFTSEELLARIRARLREKGSTNPVIKIADLELHTKSLEVKRAGKPISLTPQEYKLLEYLMNNKNQVLTREMILNRIWLYSTEVETRVVDVYMGYLRKKIDTGHKKKLIHSIRGFGYIMKE